MKLALMVEGQENVTWDDWCALAAACEEHGIGTLFRSDHYISQGDEFHNVARDAWTTIAALAARTATLRFGTRGCGSSTTCGRERSRSTRTASGSRGGP